MAEARFLRGYFHFDLKRIFNNIPYVDENVTVAANNTNVSNIEGSGYVNIWPQIEADLKFAADNLGDVGYQSQAGRANKWAAMSFLAKVYMQENKYTEAKALFDQIIPSSYGGTGAGGKTANGQAYKLVNYFSNFNPAQDNSAESVFAVQASVNEGSGTNGNYGDNLNFPYNGGPGGCCGFFNPSITLANAFKTDASGLPLFDTYNTGQIVQGKGSYSGTLDPRIDLTLGREGVPYFDWGPHPGDAWLRDPSTDGYFSPKKMSYAKAHATSLVSTEAAFWGPTQMSSRNVNLIRFSDLLLLAAEAEIEATGGSAAKALTYVNHVRQRAADPKGWVYLNSDYDAATATYKTQTTPADNYKIGTYPPGAFADKNYARKAIMFERLIELGQEGHRFFDLQRYNKVIPGFMAATLNAYATIEKNRRSIFAVNKDATFEVNKDEFFPLPQGQIDQANSYGPQVLKQNPGY
ncbi:MAG: RagB/SusD family nutrient uptake outer membrane protein [Flavisolibacter sp.]|nr:RagB/SusD family nutrient uptake outer membrane protein [Flavisolibacter sp.]